MSSEGQSEPSATPVASMQETSSQARPDRGRGRLRFLRRRSVALKVLLASCLVAPLVAVGAASAAPTPTISELRAQYEEQQHQAELAAERYNAAKENLTGIQVRVGAAKARQATQRTQVEAARRALGRIAAERYRQGDLSALNMLLSDDPDALLAQSGMLTTLGDRQVAAIERLSEAQRRLDADTADVSAQIARLQKTEREAKTAMAEAKARARAIEAKLERLTRAQRTAVTSSGGNVPVGQSCNEVSIIAPNGTVAKVIDFACDQIGKPYVYGSEGPRSFDCSGLTLRAWQAGGVTLPRTAASQSGAGTRVSVSNIRPGDLIFFYSPISHVGLYIGGGLMIHAPHSGDHVRIADARMSTIVAAARP